MAETCWFCGKCSFGTGTDLLVGGRKEVGRYMRIATIVTLYEEYPPFTVPRCERCAEIHVLEVESLSPSWVQWVGPFIALFSLCAPLGVLFLLPVQKFKYAGQESFERPPSSFRQLAERLSQSKPDESPVRVMGVVMTLVGAVALIALTFAVVAHFRFARRKKAIMRRLRSAHPDCRPKSHWKAHPRAEEARAQGFNLKLQHTSEWYRYSDAVVRRFRAGL
jgi:hypothetical protein